MRVERATRTFGDGPVVAYEGIDLDIREHETLCIVGPSGCGKATLLRTLAGMIQPTEGQVLLDGRPVTGPSPAVAMVFQHFGLFPWKTVLENAAYGLKLRGTPRREWAARLRPYLDLVGPAGCEQMCPYQLSGGMQQSAGLVRALAMNPSIPLMDEPFAALDAQTREVLQEELLRLMQRPDERKTMVFITHSIDEAIILGDRIVVLTARPGKVREIVDLPFGWPREIAAIRADARFAAIREHIWNELRPAPAAVGATA